VKEVERACKIKNQKIPRRIQRLLRLAQLYGGSDKNCDDCLDYDEFCDLVSTYAPITSSLKRYDRMRLSMLQSCCKMSDREVTQALHYSAVRQLSWP
jgi:hypothetical protein